MNELMDLPSHQSQTMPQAVRRSEGPFILRDLRVPHVHDCTSSPVPALITLPGPYRSLPLPKQQLQLVTRPASNGWQPRLLAGYPLSHHHSKGGIQ